MQHTGTIKLFIKESATYPHGFKILQI